MNCIHVYTRFDPAIYHTNPANRHHVTAHFVAPAQFVADDKMPCTICRRRQNVHP